MCGQLAEKVLCLKWKECREGARWGNFCHQLEAEAEAVYRGRSSIYELEALIIALPQDFLEYMFSRDFLELIRKRGTYVEQWRQKRGWCLQFLYLRYLHYAKGILCEV